MQTYTIASVIDSNPSSMILVISEKLGEKLLRRAGRHRYAREWIMLEVVLSDK